MMTLIKIILIGWFISDFKPLHNLINMLKRNIFTDTIYNIITCWKCSSFWTGIIWMFFEPISIFIILSASLISSILSKQKIKL